MRQIIQSVRTGALRLVEVPIPTCGPTQVLVKTTRSLISAGTEKAVRELASASLLDKARARPDLVRQVIQKAKTDGIGPTFNAVKSRLDEEMGLGYSAAGVIVAVGESVPGLLPGMRVATGGAGHAEYQLVAANLCVPIPDEVTDEEAAFATVSAIALHGLRLAELGPGASVCVIGLGLLGQIAGRLALASGLRVCGIDLRADNVDRATSSGIQGFLEKGAETTAGILEWSKGRGVDAVLMTAATGSSEPARRSPAICRDRASVVVVGDVGLELARTPFYEKELTLKFARSYGPGRYERSYEDWAVDYPAGFVRWTEGRNLESFLDLVAAKKVAVADLVTHTFDFATAEQAYELIEKATEPYVGIQLSYDESSRPTRVAEVGDRRNARLPGSISIGLIGAGGFAKNTLVPALKTLPGSQFVSVVSQSGVTARQMAEQAGFQSVGESAGQLIDDPAINTVIVCTPHESHSAYVAKALHSGKNVFCEKPLAVTEDGLASVVSALGSSNGGLMVGFNRRYSQAIETIRGVFGTEGGPLVINYRINAGSVGPKHWYHDRRQGGRIVGEVCHFIDTCTAIAGTPVESVSAFSSGRGELALVEDVVVILRYGNGSLATVTYASGGNSGAPKETFDVMGRGHVALVNDFRSISIDGKEGKPSAQDKGHKKEIEYFGHAVRSGNFSSYAKDAVESTAATFAVIESLASGQPVTPKQWL